MMMSLKKEMVGLVQQQNNYVYIVRCRDQTFYTGWTNQLEKRIEAHNAGKGAKYTKARRPVELVYFETFEHKSEALKREYQIKQLKRSEKTPVFCLEKELGENRQCSCGQIYSQKLHTCPLCGKERKA